MILLPVSCVKNKSIAPLLQEIQQTIQISPDSAAYLLLWVHDPETLNPSDKAWYGLLAGLIHYRQGKAMAEDSLIVYALDYYKTTREKEEELSLTYLLAANHYKWREDWNAYEETLDEGIEFGIANGDSILVSFMYSALREINTTNRDRMIELSHKVMEYNWYRRPGIHYNIALYYSRLGQLDSADYYFNRSIELYKEYGEGWEEELAFARRNYADHLNTKGRYDESLALAYANMKERGEINYFTLASNYLALEQLDSVQYYLDRQAREVDELYVTSANLRMSIQAILDYVNNKPVNWSKMGQYNDSIYFKSANDRKLLEEKIILKSNLEHKNLLLKLEKQRMQLSVTWIVILLVIAGVGVIFYILRKKRLFAEAEEKREVLEEMLQDVAGMQDERNRFSKKIVLQQLGLIRLVATTPTVQNQELLRQVSRIDNQQLTEDLLVWEDFYKVIDSAYDGFYSRLTARYGEILSGKEIQLCCLLCAGFSTKEISVLTGQKFQTIYQRKTTIRQKLEMGEKVDIVAFVSNV
ncbi:MAG: hypothetical protein LUG98_05360 [Tannerellaceae bacterium]|nr:hypothetical protein [Tannerellaceae bacterium]